MSGQWREVVRVAFKGPRFHDHALDLSALAELSHFQKLVADTAKALWRAHNPERERLPGHFDDRIRLCLRKIEDGSAVAPLEAYLEEPDLFGAEPVELHEAIALVHGTFRAVERDESLPEQLPKALVPEYAQWGHGLADEDAIEVILSGKEPARVTSASRSRLAAYAETTHEAQVDMTGEVLEADVRQGRFQLWLDGETGISVAFSPEQESVVTSALRDHRSARLRVVGRGEFSPSGRPLRVTQVDELQLQAAGERPYDPTARPIEEILAELATELPEEEWDRLPGDLSDNIDHYVYGTPKR